jgi:hypothetical protein
MNRDHNNQNKNKNVNQKNDQSRKDQNKDVNQKSPAQPSDANRDSGNASNNMESDRARTMGEANPLGDPLRPDDEKAPARPAEPALPVEEPHDANRPAEYVDPAAARREELAAQRSREEAAQKLKEAQAQEFADRDRERQVAANLDKAQAEHLDPNAPKERQRDKDARASEANEAGLKYVDSPEALNAQGAFKQREREEPPKASDLEDEDTTGEPAVDDPKSVGLKE